MDAVDPRIERAITRATASLPIGRTIVERLPVEAKQRQLVVV